MLEIIKKQKATTTSRIDCFSRPISILKFINRIEHILKTYANRHKDHKIVGTKYGNTFFHMQQKKGECELQQFLCVILPIRKR